MKRREEILRTGEARGDRERYAPPNADILDRARPLLRRVASRERAGAWIVILGYSFAKGLESVLKITYRAWRQRFDIGGMVRWSVDFQRDERYFLG